MNLSSLSSLRWLCAFASLAAFGAGGVLLAEGGRALPWAAGVLLLLAVAPALITLLLHRSLRQVCRIAAAMPAPAPARGAGI